MNLRLPRLNVVASACLAALVPGAATASPLQSYSFVHLLPTEPEGGAGARYAFSFTSRNDVFISGFVMFAFENEDMWGCGVFPGAISTCEYGGQSLRLVGLENGIEGTLTTISPSNGHSDLPIRISFGAELPIEMVEQFDAVISAPLSVPEPASWALMLAGFAIAGAGARRHRLGHA